MIERLFIRIFPFPITIFYLLRVQYPGRGWTKPVHVNKSNNLIFTVSSI